MECITLPLVLAIPAFLYAWHQLLADRRASRQHELAKIAASRPVPLPPIDDAAFKALQTQVNTLALRVGLAPPKTNAQS